MVASARLPSVLLAGAVHSAGASLFNYKGWLDRQQIVLAAPTVAARMAEEQPLVLMVAWGLILWATCRQVSRSVRLLALPGLQACGLQLLFLIACNAVIPTIGKMRSHHHYNGWYDAIELIIQGLTMMWACVVLPRRVVSCYVPHRDLYCHYRKKLADEPPRARTRNFTLVGLTDSDSHEEEERMEVSVTERSRKAVWCSRAGFGILLLVRPVVSPALQHQHWWNTHACVDAVMLAAGTLLVWEAGKELTKEVLHVELPNYRHLAFFIVSMVWAFELQHVMCLALGIKIHELLMLAVLHVGEVAFVTSMAAELLSPSRDPLVQIALARRGVKEAQDAREASDDESSVSSGPSPRLLCCRMCRALFDLRLNAKEIMVIGLPWPLNLSKESDTSETDESDSDQKKPPAEAVAGREAWQSWALRTGVHPAWYGKRAPHFSPVSPWGRAVSPAPSFEPQAPKEDLLSPEEQVEAFQRHGSVINKNSWWLVPADLFTDRVRCKLLAVVMVVILVVMTYSHDIFNQIALRINNPVEALGVQLCVMALLWIVFGLTVFGNNAFVSQACHRRWIIVVAMTCIGLAIHTSKSFFARSREFAGGGAVRILDVFDDVQQRWADFSVGILSFLGFFLAVHLFMSPEDSNDFHQCEFHALWYTSDMLLPVGKVADLRRHPPKQGEQLYYIGRTAEGDVKCTVEKDNGDGTCDVMLADGRRLAQERHKFFRRTKRGGRKEEDTLDAELKRLKALRPASEDYPAVLYLGAISALPLLLAMACALLLAVRTVLHVVFRLHVYASLLNFCLHSTVVPPGPAGATEAAQADLARNVFAWRLDGGTGLADGVNLPRVANVTGLNYRMDWMHPDEPSLPCEELPESDKLMVFLAMGGHPSHVRLSTIEKGITHTMQVIWGVSSPNVEKVADGIEKLWDVLSDGDKDFTFNSRKAGQLLCEAKLLSSVRLKTAGSAALVAGQRLVTTLAINATSAVEEQLDRTSFGSWPVVGHYRDVLLEWLQEVQQALIQYEEGGLGASAKLVDELESGLQRSLPFVRAATHLARGGAPDAETLVEMLDKNGNGKLSLKQEAPALVSLGIELCRKAGCGHMVEGKIWEALAYADSDEDGELSVEDIKHVGKALKDAFNMGKRLMTGVCGVAGSTGILAGAVGTANIIGQQPQKVPGWQELLTAFDSNGDSALTIQEVMDPVSKLVEGTSGCKGSDWLLHQAADLADQAGLGRVLAAFKRADINKDGRLTLDEAALGGFAEEVAKLCPEEKRQQQEQQQQQLPGAPDASGAAGVAAATARRLGVADKLGAELGAVEAKIGQVGETVNDAEIVIGHFGHLKLSQSLKIVDSLIGGLSNGAICLILVGVNWVLYMSVFAGMICQMYVLGRCFAKYRQLFESMQSGRHDYIGCTARGDLQQGFAEVTMFPGMLFGTTFFGFLFVSVLVFFLLIVGIVAAMPFCHGIWLKIYPVLLYLTLAFCLKQVIRYVVMDMMLAEKGEIVYPQLFSLFWFILLLLNFVLGVSTAVFRSVLVLLWAVVSCCFVDFTLMSEPLVSWDSAYYSLLTMAYTHHVRRNPIKKAMVCALFRHIQSIEKDSSEEANGDSEQPPRQVPETNVPLWRARARFWLALTLHHNPELRHLRRRQTKQVDLPETEQD